MTVSIVLPRRRPGRPEHPVSRAHLIRMARDVFSEENFDGASMARIAEKAGLQKSSLFHHFATKESLYVAVMTDAVMPFKSLLEKAAIAVSTQQMTAPVFLAVLDQLSADISREFCTDETTAPLLLQELQRPHMVQMSSELVMHVSALTMSFLEQGMRCGAIATDDIKSVYLAMLGLHLSHRGLPALRKAVITTPTPIDASVSFLQRSVRRLLGAPPIS
jgi:AcrR family transcriptional regulator